MLFAYLSIRKAVFAFHLRAKELHILLIIVNASGKNAAIIVDLCACNNMLLASKQNALNFDVK